MREPVGLSGQWEGGQVLLARSETGQVLVAALAVVVLELASGRTRLHSPLAGLGPVRTPPHPILSPTPGRAPGLEAFPHDKRDAVTLRASS